MLWQEDRIAAQFLPSMGVDPSSGGYSIATSSDIDAEAMDEAPMLSSPPKLPTPKATNRGQIARVSSHKRHRPSLRSSNSSLPPLGAEEGGELKWADQKLAAAFELWGKLGFSLNKFIRALVHGRLNGESVQH